MGEYRPRAPAEIHVEGRNQTRKWTDKNAVERYTTEIIGSEMQMLGKKKRSGRSSERPGGDFGPAADSDPDDIPF
ncbi:MAG: single-stranded DNA-binding protein [Propionivibrio sp.]|nr:single-stranded DNA-binding protein [Propionivibrio sp.]